MKSVEEWGQDELCTAALVALFGYGVWRALHDWWNRRGPAWLQANHIVNAPGHGLINLGHIGSLDAPRIIGIVAIVVVVRLAGRHALASAVARKVQRGNQKSPQQRDQLA